MSSPAHAVAALARDRLEHDDEGTPRVVVVGIDGRSGAGKSTLASDVVALLEGRGDGGQGTGSARRVELVRLDDHYPGWSGLLAGVVAVRPMLDALRRGSAGTAPTWDWLRSAPGADRVIPAPGHALPDVVVVEGCGTTLLHQLLDALVWLDEPAGVRRARAESREGDVSSWWDTWARQEDAAIAQTDPTEHADLRLTAAR
ncbi:hypothetical protein ACPYO6_07395 [Georgenia sp. Z1344]|uniref:hypothetical protein n=1 Tax=Georgenia sp. Z1344 TaxID=3416706 RepID=UPI003CF5CB56